MQDRSQQGHYTANSNNLHQLHPSAFSTEAEANYRLNPNVMQTEEDKGALRHELLAPMAIHDDEREREREVTAAGASSEGQPLLSSSGSPTGNYLPLISTPHSPQIKYKQYPPPQYKWDPGNFRRGPWGLCYCPSDAYRSIILAAISLAPGTVFLAAVRASSDIESFVIVPLLTLGIILCLLFATTCDPGVYRKRYISPTDMARVKRQQIRRENELRKKRNLPLIPTDSEGNYANLGSTQGAQHAVVQVVATAAAPSPSDAEVSDEDHPNRLNFDRKAFISVGGRNADLYKVECGMCTACGIMRNPRVGHCFHCNVCVDGFDHHCGVLGSCVGKRNFRFFAGFLYCTTFLCLYIIVRVIIVLSSDVTWGTVWDTTAGQFRIVASIILLVVLGCGGGCMTGPMMIYYVQLAAFNSTQKQDGNYHSKVGQGSYVANPYRTNMCYDYCTRMFGPLGASRADWHGREGTLHPTHDR